MCESNTSFDEWRFLSIYFSDDWQEENKNVVSYTAG